MIKNVIALVVVLVLTCVVPTPAADAVGSVAGTYAVRGTNFDKSTYTLEVRIQSTDSKAALEYFFQGQLIAVGLGIRTKDVLSVIFQTSEGVIGLSSYKIERNRLIGDWLLPGLDGLGGEQFNRIPELTTPAPRPLEKLGTHTI